MLLPQYMASLNNLFTEYVDIGFTVAARVPAEGDADVAPGIFTIVGRPKAVKNGKVQTMIGSYEAHINTIATFRQHVADGDDLAWPEKE